MNNDRHLTALGLAHALLAGDDTRREALLARTEAALGARPAWLIEMIDQLFPMPCATWDRMTIAALAERLETSPAFIGSLRSSRHTVIRRWILRASHMLPRPLGLDHLVLPKLDHSEALAGWLGIPVQDLLWFANCPPRRRRLPLHCQHYAFAIQAKRSGGARLIEAPHQRLKAVQVRILADLLDRVPVHEACHGFVRGRSVLSHARHHVGRPVLVRFDLKDFFATVTAAQVKAVFETLGYPPGVAQDLSALCTVRTPDPVLERMREDESLDWFQAKCLRNAHLPQGSPSSPMLANLCAFQLDLRLSGLAYALGATYSRYADDLVFSGPESLQHAFARLSGWVGKIALEEGYRINHRKTHLMTQATAQTVCGVVVNTHANMKRADFDRLRAVLHQCVLAGPASQSSLEIGEWRRHLHGRLAWAEQINPDKARRLRQLWDRIAWPAEPATTISA